MFCEEVTQTARRSAPEERLRMVLFFRDWWWGEFSRTFPPRAVAPLWLAQLHPPPAPRDDSTAGGPCCVLFDAASSMDVDGQLSPACR
eukprot:7004041-Alexandrium_andersonii.AAC.1